MLYFSKQSEMFEERDKVKQQIFYCVLIDAGSPLSVKLLSKAFQMINLIDQFLCKNTRCPVYGKEP